MKNEAITAKNLGKKYLIRHQVPYKRFSEELINSLKYFTASIAKPFYNFNIKKWGRKDFWALQNISFDIQEGERVGIIGRNGAGKSTLLKILSRITEPTTGKALISGRLASLLEVGTGFHPELTGRENIYLNGSILGMSKSQIKKKFDEIIAFSELENFLDTPVKHYSSGMYVRLAFAVAAHLEPDILLIDEVLAVGDLQFQKKCLGKMNQVTKEGRTVLFVSHNMQAIRSLCQRTILIHKGKIITDSRTNQALSNYHKLLKDIVIDSETEIDNKNCRRNTGDVRITSFKIENSEGEEVIYHKMGSKIHFKIEYKTLRQMPGIAFFIALRSGITREFITTIRYILSHKTVLQGSYGFAEIVLPNICLRPGEYPLYIHLGGKEFDSKHYDILDDATAPLMITLDTREERDFNSSRPLGYFSLESLLKENKI